MAKDMEKASAYNLLDQGSVGEIRIADEVVAIISGIAVSEVSGVAEMAGGFAGKESYFLAV